MNVWRILHVGYSGSAHIQKTMHLASATMKLRVWKPSQKGKRASDSVARHRSSHVLQVVLMVKHQITRRLLRLANAGIETRYSALLAFPVISSKYVIACRQVNTVTVAFAANLGCSYHKSEQSSAFHILVADMASICYPAWIVCVYLALPVHSRVSTQSVRSLLYRSGTSGSEQSRRRAVKGKHALQRCSGKMAI